MKIACETCEYFHPYYKIYRTSLIKLSIGHCVRKRSAPPSPCPKYIFKDLEKEERKLLAEREILSISKRVNAILKILDAK